MPRVRNMDGSIGVSDKDGWLAPPSLPMCEPTQVQYSGEGGSAKGGRLEAWGEPGKPWPFLYVYREGRCFINTSPCRSAYAQAEDVGDALI